MSFRGDLAFIHALEGHSGSAYWPGGASGVTLDPGVDLGYVETYLFERAYRLLLTQEQMVACQAALGVRGTAARQLVGASEVLRSIRIEPEQAEEIFPLCAAPYWGDICARFPVLRSGEVPAVVQTVFLSLAYNRGPANADLAVLRAPLQAHDWQLLADLISDMQNDHVLEGVARRRDRESEYLREELAAQLRRRRRYRAVANHMRGEKVAPRPLHLWPPTPADTRQQAPERTDAYERLRPAHERMLRKVKQPAIWGSVGSALLAGLALVEPAMFAGLGAWAVPLAAVAMTGLQTAIGYFTPSDPQDFPQEQKAKPTPAFTTTNHEPQRGTHMADIQQTQEAVAAVIDVSKKLAQVGRDGFDVQDGMVVITDPGLQQAIIKAADGSDEIAGELADLDAVEALTLTVQGAEGVRDVLVIWRGPATSPPAEQH